MKLLKIIHKNKDKEYLIHALEIDGFLFPLDKCPRNSIEKDYLEIEKEEEGYVSEGRLLFE